MKITNERLKAEMKLTADERKIHRWGIKLSKAQRTHDAEKVRFLQTAQKSAFFKKLGYRSLHVYANEFLKFDITDIAAALAVSNKALKVLPLHEAIQTSRITMAAANRILSTITIENADEVIEFTRTHSYREVEREMARRNPKRRQPDKIRAINEHMTELRIVVPNESLIEAERFRSLEATKGNLLSLGEAYVMAMHREVERQDPVKKAQRNEERKQKRAERHARDCAKQMGQNTFAQNESAQKSWAPRIFESETREPSNSSQDDVGLRIPNYEPVAAEIQRQLDLRDQGCCTQEDENGKRCGSDRWPHTHHIIPRSQGGQTRWRI